VILKPDPVAIQLPTVNRLGRQLIGRGSRLSMRSHSMRKTSVAGGVTLATYAVYVCLNSNCEDGEFVSHIPPIYLDLPACPCCGCPAILLEVLRREGDG
jgi:hypothetical protein